jgi:hypothetical protein
MTNKPITRSRTNNFDAFDEIKSLRKEKELATYIRIMLEKRINILMNGAVCFVCQLLMVCLIMYQIAVYQWKEFTVYETSVLMILARFVCAIILHLALIDELSAGLEKMKFACNHKRDFVDWKMAYVSGLMQSLILMTVEFVCMSIIITSNEPLDIVYNFVSLAIIAEFDNYIY